MQSVNGEQFSNTTYKPLFRPFAANSATVIESLALTETLLKFFLLSVNLFDHTLYHCI